MMRYLLAIFLIFSHNSYANWDINQNGVAVQNSANDPASFAILSYSDESYYIAFADAANVLARSGCKEEGDEVIREVNSQAVKFIQGCEMDIYKLYPKAAEGATFIFNEFTKKNSVKVGDSEFSAIGFSSAVEKLKQRTEWESNAL